MSHRARPQQAHPKERGSKDAGLLATWRRQAAGGARNGRAAGPAGVAAAVLWQQQGRTFERGLAPAANANPSAGPSPAPRQAADAYPDRRQRVRHASHRRTTRQPALARKESRCTAHADDGARVVISVQQQPAVPSVPSGVPLLAPALHAHAFRDATALGTRANRVASTLRCRSQPQKNEAAPTQEVRRRRLRPRHARHCARRWRSARS